MLKLEKKTQKNNELVQESPLSTHNNLKLDELRDLKVNPVVPHTIPHTFCPISVICGVKVIFNQLGLCWGGGDVKRNPVGKCNLLIFSLNWFLSLISFFFRHFQAMHIKNMFYVYIYENYQLLGPNLFYCFSKEFSDLKKMKTICTSKFA